MSDFDHVAAEYDSIGREYQESKRLPFRLHIEEHSMFTLLPDLAGRSVVDLACGEGIYSRKLLRRGAARGRRGHFARDGVPCPTSGGSGAIGAEYVVADVATVEMGEHFDVALCSFLFNYARSRDELRSLVKSVAGLLRPGGSVIGCNDYPDNPPAHFNRYRPYGFVKFGAAEPEEGSTITYRFYNPDGTVFEIDNDYLPTEAYRSEFRLAGFTSFDWVMPTVSPEGRSFFPPGYWDTYVDSPPMVSLMATAGGA